MVIMALTFRDISPTWAKHIISNPMITAPAAFGAAYYMLGKAQPNMDSSKKILISSAPAFASGFISNLLSSGLESDK